MRSGASPTSCSLIYSRRATSATRLTPRVRALCRRGGSLPIIRAVHRRRRIHFIASPDANPAVQLTVVRTVRPVEPSSTPYALLDAPCTHILAHALWDPARLCVGVSFRRGVDGHRSDRTVLINSAH